MINLEHTVAVTQNYVSECNLKKVYTFLKTKQVCRSLWWPPPNGRKQLGLSERFSKALKEHEPELYAKLLEETNEIEGGWDTLVEDDDDWQLSF